MSAVLNRLARRRSYPITIDGEDFRVRAMTIGEGLEFDTLKDDGAKIGFILGCALLNDAGEPEFNRAIAADTVLDDKQAAAESAEDFGKRVSEACRGIPQDTLAALTSAIDKLRRPPSQDTLRKNSDATKQPGSP